MRVFLDRSIVIFKELTVDAVYLKKMRMAIFPVDGIDADSSS
jgi:hypothetical protein